MSLIEVGFFLRHSRFRREFCVGIFVLPLSAQLQAAPRTGIVSVLKKDLDGLAFIVAWRNARIIVDAGQGPAKKPLHPHGLGSYAGSRWSLC